MLSLAISSKFQLISTYLCSLQLLSTNLSFLCSFCLFLFQAANLNVFPSTLSYPFGIISAFFILAFYFQLCVYFKQALACTVFLQEMEFLYLCGILVHLRVQLVDDSQLSQCRLGQDDFCPPRVALFSPLTVIRLICQINIYTS